uniref:non-specific serine/threonine protein kinase n=1 Tax=Anthurium amnicola TaxID=1678845 RepID=A0A1D1YB20_9ARAE
MARPRHPSGRPPLWFALFAAAAALFFPTRCQPSCRSGCDLALASYYVTDGQTLTGIASLFGIGAPEDVLPYNQLPNKNSIWANSRVNIPFACGCSDGEFRSQSFSYHTRRGDTYIRISGEVYHNLTTWVLLRKVSGYPTRQIPVDMPINVAVKCFCGDPVVSRAYGLFLTYPLRPGDTLETVATSVGFNDSALLQRYNQGTNFSAGQGIVYLPTKDPDGSYRPLKVRRGISGGATAGISVAAIVFLILIVSLSIGIYKIKKREDRFLSSVADAGSHVQGQGVATVVDETSVTTPPPEAHSTLTEMSLDMLVFSYKELAKATDNFNMANKIGEGGFGAVYYAELRGEKAAIKKMDMQATRAFLAELKVLTHVHHLNLVRLIGYCIQSSLFLVYEYIENGNLSQHLRGIADKGPLPWSARVQIALDSARGLEYIHEHTVPLYIHRDIKSANILIDKNFRGKVADFGLTRLTEVGSGSLQTGNFVGTFGYMSPEYARYGDVSPKMDVYAFGVVLYELISAKEAVVRPNGSGNESMGLISLFEDALSKPDPRENLHELIDSRLGENYTIDSVYKMAQLARACTEENPHLRPSMRSIVVALMALSSSTEDWDVASFYENQAIVNLMSGR